ncbi:MAG: 2-amino-4-hydroxy-6-hydroxymethyldihydropteridine diphosphokinase [Acidimicrobiia bacterium]
MTRYAIALGSNLGDRVAHLRAAVTGIGGLGEIEALSGLYETAPVGGPDQDPYLNAVVVVSSSLSAEDLLARLQSIEAGRGRERSIRWGPRTLDLDIITTDADTIDTPDLVVPHPRATQRRFVLEPLCDVWPEAVVAEGLTAAEARNLVEGQEVERLASTWVDDGPAPGRYWVGAQFLLFLGIAAALVMDGSLPGATPDFVSDGPGDGWRIVGGVLLIVGGLGVVASALSLGRALSALPEPIEGAHLIESGLYAHVRHPMYGSLCLATLGASLLLASTTAILLSIGLFAFFMVKSDYEERRLRIAYPAYTGYRGRVRRRMIPFLL